MQCNVALNRSEKILSISDKNWFVRHFQWKGLFGLNKYLIGGTLSADGFRWRAGRL